MASGGKHVSAELGERLASSVQRDDRKPPHELLSNREFEVLKQIASGKSTREIAVAMSLSVQTVSTYRSRIRQKTQLKSVAEITAYALKNRLLDF